jgi:hypothetical protein
MRPICSTVKKAVSAFLGLGFSAFETRLAGFPVRILSYTAKSKAALKKLKTCVFV